MHCCSAEREVDGALNVLRRGSICMLYCSYIFIISLTHTHTLTHSLTHSLSLSLSLFSLTTSGWAKPHIICVLTTSRWFFLYFFGKVPKTLALRFWGCRVGVDVWNARFAQVTCSAFLPPSLPPRHLPLKIRRPRLLWYPDVVSFRGTGNFGKNNVLRPRSSCARVL